jgi:hypothetical protein
MRGVSLALAICMVGTSAARADQPEPPVPFPPAPAEPAPPPPADGWSVAPKPAPRLTVDERELLARGEISSGQHVGGGLVGTFVGFGIGHAVQGRYIDRGWIFTLGELASMGALVAGVSSCLQDSISSRGSRSCDDTFIIGGLVGLLGFRIWEIVDVWGGPAWHNERVRELRERAPKGPSWDRASFYGAPAAGGGRAGLVLRF